MTLKQVQELLIAEDIAEEGNFPYMDGRYILPIEGEEAYLAEDLRDAGATYEETTGLWVYKM